MSETMSIITFMIFQRKNNQYQWAMLIWEFPAIDSDEFSCDIIYFDLFSSIFIGFPSYSAILWYDLTPCQPRV